MYDELLDIVNKHDQVIGQRYRSEIWRDNIKNFRTVNAFLINDQKRIWIPRRSPHKKLFPLCLDSSMGGHVMTGESYDQAFERELYEELNLDLCAVQYFLVTKLTPDQHSVSSYTQMYVINFNANPDYNKNDFIEYKWMAIQELEEKINEGEAVKSDLPILVNFLQKWLIFNAI